MEIKLSALEVKQIVAEWLNAKKILKDKVIRPEDIWEDLENIDGYAENGMTFEGFTITIRNDK